jgi:precorrin-2 dehydrogenase/sirohydrochlorin ferrochelatase
MPGYPIELNLAGRPALVVGLGSVGRRRAIGLVQAGAGVIAVDPAANRAGLPEGIEVRAEPYQRAHLRRVALAFAAAPAAVNRRVVRDARRRGVWVNSASDPSTGDFSVPATWRDGMLTLTVSTTGASPALAMALRDRFAALVGPAAAGLTSLLADLRPIVRERVPDPKLRRRIMAEWADPRWLTLWTAKGQEAVRRELLRIIEGHSQ